MPDKTVKTPRITLSSTVGEPQKGFSLGKNEFAKGEKLGGFIFPFNTFADTQEIFRRFGLWQSSQGICLDGIAHTVFKMGRYQAMTQKPVLTGDFVRGKQVIESHCIYLDRLKMWQCRLVFGTPSLHNAYTQYQNSLLLSSAQLHSELAQALTTLFSNFLQQALAMATDSRAVPLNISLAIPALQALQTQFLHEVNHHIQIYQEKFWH